MDNFYNDLALKSSVYIHTDNNESRIKITLRDVHDHCLIFGEQNHDPFCCLITYDGCMNIVGSIDSERSGYLFALSVSKWTTATVIAANIYSSSIIVDYD